MTVLALAIALVQSHNFIDGIITAFPQIIFGQ